MNKKLENILTSIVAFVIILAATVAIVSLAIWIIVWAWTNIMAVV